MSDHIYRFEYADKSAFVITEEGRAFVEWPDGRREEKTGRVSNRIRTVIGMAVKPRQDLIDEMEKALQATLCELSCCADQLKARGLPGHPGDSVERAQIAARAALAKARA